MDTQPQLPERYISIVVNEYDRINVLYEQAVESNDWIAEGAYAFILNSISSTALRHHNYDIYNKLS